LSNLFVITFDDVREARAAREALGKLAGQGLLKVVDAAVITRDADNKLRVDNELESSTKTGALVGGLLGGLLSFLFPPAGIVVGAVAGALVGKTIEPGVDQGFVKEVSAALKPGSSALFFMFDADDPAGALAALRPFRGTLYQTTLSSETEESLRHALE
jgi:uncharacterized membrane protein